MPLKWSAPESLKYRQFSFKRYLEQLLVKQDKENLNIFHFLVMSGVLELFCGRSFPWVRPSTLVGELLKIDVDTVFDP